MRSSALLVLSSLGATAVLVTTAAPARAGDVAIAVPLTGFSDIVVDDAHGHVFLSGGRSDGLVVRDLEGAAVTVITNEPGAAQMALSDDGSRLYVALKSGDAISAIDTSTLTEVARYPTGAATCPSTIAFASAKVWFGYGCDQWDANLGVVDPSAVPAAVTTGLLGADVYAVPAVASSPAAPGLLLLVGATTADGLRKADVSSGSLVLGANRTDIVANDLAITADGTHVITAAGSPYHHPAYRLSDLSSDGVYGNENPYPVAVATGAGGLVAAGVDGAEDPDVVLYRADGTRIRSYGFGGCCNPGESTSLATRGLALSADTSRLYAITTDYLGDTVLLRVLRDPGKAVSTIALTRPASASINRAYSLAGTLSSAIPVPSGAVLTVQRDGMDGTVTLPSTTAASNGTFTITDSVPKRGTYGYRTTWAGDDTHAGSTVRVPVKVLGVTPSVSVTTSAGPYSYGAKPLVVAHLGTTNVRTLSIYAQPYGGAKVRLKTGTVDSHGNLSVAYTITRRTTFTASFPGDATYEPRSVAKSFTSRAKVVTGLRGYYSTSGGYRLFHASIDPTLVVSVGPSNVGACTSYVAQVYSSGAWRTTATRSCEVLDDLSHAAVVFHSTAPAGRRFRIRATFKGSLRNVATTAAWQYGKFTT